MSNAKPLTLEQKQYIVDQKLKGHTLKEIAEKLGYGYDCIRKWWRRGRRGGLDSLAQTSSRPKGRLAHHDPLVAARAKSLKQSHPNWGADRLGVALREDASLMGMKLPSRSSLTAYFREVCPEAVRQRCRQPKHESPMTPTSHPHELWQLDMKEAIKLENEEIATLLTVRDVHSGAFIGLCVFSVATDTSWRKLTYSEFRDSLRTLFTRWGMPEKIQTDNELRLAGGNKREKPGLLTLWLTGLGIKHQFSRPGCPTDQAHVERGHGIISNFAFDGTALQNTDLLGQRCEHEAHLYNTLFPSRHQGCQGKPPLEAFPTLTQPLRPYALAHELALFSRQRVVDLLAQYTLKRTVNAVGQISFNNTGYYLGKTYVKQSVTLKLDTASAQWAVYQQDGTLIKHLDTPDLDVDYLTGLTKELLAQPEQPFQLPLWTSIEYEIVNEPQV